HRERIVAADGGAIASTGREGANDMLARSWTCFPFPGPTVASRNGALVRMAWMSREDRAAAAMTTVGTEHPSGELVSTDRKGHAGDGSENFSRLRQQIEGETNGAYSVFRRTLTPRYAVVWRDLLLGWTFVVAAAIVLVMAQDRLAEAWVWLV